MQKPNGLKIGDTIGIVAPSSPVIHKVIEKAIKQLEAWGYKVRVGDSCYQKQRYLSGADDVRANDINRFFKDKGIKAILCLRGGYGSARILPSIDYSTIIENPKIFVGFSDITSLHIAINKYCKLVTFHGPMAINISEGLDYFTKTELLRMLSTDAPFYNLTNPNGEVFKSLVEGEAIGEVIGGNLSIINSTLGTPYEINTTKKILFIEEISEEPYRIDRMLTQLILSGKLQAVSGIILGNFHQCEGKDAESSSLMEVLLERLVPLKKPTIYGVKAGHCMPQLTIPFGLQTYINPLKGIIRIEESGIKT